MIVAFCRGAGWCIDFVLHVGKQGTQNGGKRS